MNVRFVPQIFDKYLTMVVAFMAMALAPRTMAQSDNFDDGNDDGWTRFGLQSAGLPPAQYSFPPTPGGGRGYRIFTPAPPVPDAGPARAFSYRTNITYSDFHAAVDVLAWDNSINQAFGFLFHADNIGLGQTTGYVMNYDPNQQSGGRGQFQINRVTSEAPTTIAAANLSLDPGRQYRFVLTAVSNLLTAHVYDLNDLTKPLVTISATDDVYPSGFIGLFNFSRVNAASYTNPDTGKADVTFDNFVADVIAPDSITFPGTPSAIAGLPQVVDRSPEARATFYAATNGIRFRATTLTTNQVDRASIRLFLNGTDVSSNLVISGSSTNFDVRYDGLRSNTVYDARVILSDPTGRTATNEWTFDTLTEAFLYSGLAEVIEAEDYNYGDGICNSLAPTSGGLFEDDPNASGFSGGTRVPADETGYAGKYGLAGVDYFDREANTFRDVEHAYRFCDAVGTQAGAVVHENTAAENDVVRDRNSALGLPEYEVARTQGGEWLNYTRVFAARNYNVYLRVAGRSTQQVFLDTVSNPGEPEQVTAPLGVFNVPNLGLLSNYRFVPLVNTNGALAAVRLADTTTVRLTLGGPAQSSTENTLLLNYMVFVPVAESAGSPVQLFDAHVNTNRFIFSFQSDAGRNYNIQYKNSLSGSSWTNLITRPGTGGRIEVLDPLTHSNRFSRVVTE